MNTPTHNITTQNILPTDHGNLTQPLQSAVFISMLDSKDKVTATGHRWCKLIKKGENSKLAASIAVEIPQSSYYFGEVLASSPAIVSYLQNAMESLESGLIKSRAEAGALSIQYSEISLSNLEAFAASDNIANGIGQISSERITAWFTSELRDVWIVALADKLGISDTATAEEIIKLEQIANQTRDNLAKLSSKKPVSFDIRVKNALNKALDLVSSDDTFAARLQAKLNLSVGGEDMLANLGM